MSNCEQEKDKEFVESQPLYLTKQIVLRKIHFESEKLHIILRDLRINYQDQCFTYDLTRKYLEEEFKTIRYKIDKEFAVFKQLEQAEENIRLIQCIAEKTPISRDGTFEDFKVLYPEEEEEYSYWDLTYNFRHATHQVQRFLEKFK